MGVQLRLPGLAMTLSPTLRQCHPGLSAQAKAVFCAMQATLISAPVTTLLAFSSGPHPPVLTLIDLHQALLLQPTGQPFPFLSHNLQMGYCSKELCASFLAEG